MDILTRYCTVFEPDDVVELRLLGTGLRPIKLWAKASRLPDKFAELMELNHRGYNIYVGPNPRKAEGLSGDSSVKLARCLFVDFDGIESGDGCGRSEFILLKIYEQNLPSPDMVISSGHGIHCYWRLTKPIDDLDHWRKLQERLNNHLGSDTAIKNPERLMRLPGFQNHKCDPTTDCFIIY